METKEGWLIKKAGFVFKTWEQRWCTIEIGRFGYYRMRSDPGPRVQIDLSTTSVHRAAEGKVGAPTAFCFEVVYPFEDGTKSFFFACESEEEMNSWLAAFKEHGSAVSGSTEGQEQEKHLKISGSVPGDPSMSSEHEDLLQITTSADPTMFLPPEEMDENARTVLSRVWPCPSDLLQTPHTLIKTGELMEFDPLKGDRQTTQLLLFNDVLLLTSKDKDGYYNLKVHMSLRNNPSLFASTDSPLELQIRTHTRKTFILYARNEEERNSWASCISQAISSTTSYRNTPTITPQRSDDEGWQSSETPEIGAL